MKPATVTTAPAAGLIATMVRFGRAATVCAKSARVALLVMPAGDGVLAVNKPAVGRCDGSEACRRDCGKICVHAEEGVILMAGRHAEGADVVHLKLVDGLPVPSGDPSCHTCSRLMLRAGVARMWLLQSDGWRSWSALEFHRATLAHLGLHVVDG